MQIVSNIALITINETLFIQVLSFLIFLFIINRVMFRPLRHTMMQRDNYIEKIQQEIEQQKDEIKKLEKTIHKKENAVISEAYKMQKKLEDAGNKEAVAIFETTHHEIEALKKKTALDIETSIAQARKYLKEESEALVLDVIEKVLDRRPAP